MHDKLRCAALPLLGLGLASCAQLLGADDFSKQSEFVSTDGEASEAGAPSSDADVGDAERPALYAPKPPAFSAPDCTACIDKSCTSQLAACNADSFCSSHLTTIQELPSAAYPSPELLLELMAAETRSSLNQDQHFPVLSEFLTCARRQCRTACELGRDFSCVNAFDWPKSYPKRADVSFRVVDFASRQGVDGLRVRACALLGQTCPSPLADTKTDSNGFVTASIDFALAPPLSLFAEFDGFWLIDGRPDFPRFKLQSTRPYFDGYFATLPLFPSAIASLTGIGGSGTSDYSGRLLVAPYDCRDEPAKGVVLEVWRPESDGYHPCSACGPIVYSDDDHLPAPDLTEYGSAGLQASVDVPADAIGDLMLVIRDTKSRLPVGVLRRVGGQPGGFAILSVVAASMTQFKTLPPAAR